MASEDLDKAEVTSLVATLTGTVAEQVEKLHVDESAVINVKGSVDDNVTRIPDKVFANGKEENAKNETAEDDESDGEIIDSDENETNDVQPKVDYSGLDDVVRPELDQLDYDEDVDEGEIKDEKKEDTKDTKDESKEGKEMSEGEIASSDGEVVSDSENKKPARSGFVNDDYEEGEMIDPSDAPIVPRGTCRFFERGNCTWGDRCRFIHPGVNDKGSYKMFDDDKPQPPIHAPPPVRFPPPLDPRAYPGPPNMPPGMIFGPPPPETAWERGLRHAKEMRKRAMQRKVEEPDFMRKREVLSLNEALNVDRDMDYIAHKPLADEEKGVDPFGVLEEDERYAVPSLDEVKKYKRFEKSHHRDGRRSPNHDLIRRQMSPGNHVHREVHERGRERRSPRHPGMPSYHSHERHQPPPMPHRDHSLRHEYRDKREANDGERRHDREYRDRRMNDFKERDHRMEQSRNYPPDNERAPRGRELESRVVPVDNSLHKKKSMHGGRGDTWSDPWARGRQGTKKRASRSDSESSGSSSSSSRSSYSSRSGSSYSSRSSSRSSYSSSSSSSGSSRSPSPKKETKKVVKTKKIVTKKTAPQKAKDSPKPLKPTAKQVPSKKAAEIVKAKLTKPVAKPAAPIAKPPAKDKVPERGRLPVKAVTKKVKQKKYESSSSSEFSHSSSSEDSRSRSREKGSESDSDSGSSSGSSSGSDSYSSSSSSSGSSDEEEKPKQVKKKTALKSAVPSTGKKPTGKVPVPSKPGNKNLKMTINEKTTAKPSAPTESRKRSAAAMSGNVPVKKVSAIANRRVELLEQLKVVENAILKKRAKLT